MKTKRFRSIDIPIKLRLEFDDITLGELSNFLRQWQALLRAAWRESFELSDLGSAPRVHILVASASTENSFDILSYIAIHSDHVAAVFGTAKDWAPSVRDVLSFLGLVWSRREAQIARDDSDRLYIRGGDSPEMSVGGDLLRDSETGRRIQHLWEIANSGAVKITISGPDDEGN